MHVYDFQCSISGNYISHLLIRDFADIHLSKSKFKRTDVFQFTLPDSQTAVIFPRSRSDGYGDYEYVYVGNNTSLRLIRSPLLKETDDVARASNISSTWRVRSLVDQSESIGMRDAQRGAIHSLLAHWTRSDSIASVVMPTGTGKTETLLTAIALKKPRCALVVVPTDPLRYQLSEKALSWGILHELKVLDEKSAFPLVGILRKNIRKSKELQKFFNACNIVVTTMSILSGMNKDQFEVITNHCDFVSIDEAHHVPAKTWSRVVNAFSEATLVQFTATPFRQDGKHIDGDIVYSYPLSKCQEQGFFKPIHFLPVTEYIDSKSDEKVSEIALRRLRSDLAAGYDHAMMARVSTKDRARTILELYRRKASNLNPVMIFSGMTESEKNLSKQVLLSGKSKVVVCVDMLGEGFDCSSLKIAAIHDAHKSLPITLQFIGRFTRDGSGNIGEASVVANIANEGVRSNISSLYSQDADWNSLIQGSYENAVGHEVDFQKFINSFVFDGITGFSLRSIHPKFSAFVYSTTGVVDLEKLKNEYNDGDVYRLAINTKDNIAVIVEKEVSSVDWGSVKELANLNYNCNVVLEDSETGLLFIFASGRSVPDKIATSVCALAQRVADKRINRCMGGINRLLLSNVGLKRRLVGPIRYRQYMGLDVGEGMNESNMENSYLAMLFGSGYELGDRENVGCSQKGKLWSRDAGDLVQWSRWCRRMGAKIIDDTILVEDILEGALFPEQIDSFDSFRTVVCADWSDFIFETNFDRIEIHSGSRKWEVFDCDFRVSNELVDSRIINYELVYGTQSTRYELELKKDKPEGYDINCLDETDVTIKAGKDTLDGVDFFKKNPPVFWLDDASVIVEGCLRVRSNQVHEGVLFDQSRVFSRHWKETDIKVESQGKEKKANSIQRAMIEEVLADNPLFVFDDDGSGEVADIVVAEEKQDHALIRLYHCKYSQGSEPGLRVSDIYELAGQAQKSVKWAGNLELLVKHLRRREILRQNKNEPSRFETGGMSSLNTLISISRQKRLKYEVILVQPGLSKKSFSCGSPGAQNIMRILGAVKAYLAETFEIRLSLVISE